MHRCHKLRRVVPRWWIAPVLLLLAKSVAAQSETWPQSEGGAVTAAFCGACHSLALVQSQSLQRSEWDRVLRWMSDTQNMPRIQEPLRGQILDFLVREFGPTLAEASGLPDRVSGLQGIRYRPALAATSQD